MCVHMHIQMDTSKNMQGVGLSPHFYILNPSMVVVTLRLKIEDGSKKYPFCSQRRFLRKSYQLWMAPLKTMIRGGLFLLWLSRHCTNGHRNSGVLVKVTWPRKCIQEQDYNRGHLGA